jgi:hypothetical protein
MKISLILYGIAIVSSAAGILAMFAAKIAAYERGIFLSRIEAHWFNDSITAFLLSLNLLAFMFLIQKK